MVCIGGILKLSNMPIMENKCFLISKGFELTPKLDITYIQLIVDQYK